MTQMSPYGECQIRASSFADLTNVVVIDVETTGLDPTRDRIIEVGAVRGALARLSDADGHSHVFGARVNPEIAIPEEASRIHGIRDEDVESMEPFPRIALKLREFIGDSAIVAYNAAFDTAFVNAELARAGVSNVASNPAYCAMLRFRHHYPGRHSLNVAVNTLGIRGREGRYHGALEDAFLAARVATALYRIDVTEPD